MLEYLSSPLLVIKSFRYSCGLMLWGDFNPLKISCLASQLKPKQLIGKEMQGDLTLLTNLSSLYDKNYVEIIQQ